MIATDTLNYLKKYAEACIPDDCSDKYCLCSDNYPNIEPMLYNKTAVESSTNDSLITLTNKSYEKSNNCLIESYFELDDSDDSIEFTSDYGNSFPNGVIMVVNNGLKSNDIQILKKGFSSQLKYLIVSKSANYIFNQSNNCTYSEIVADNLDEAVETAYNLASEGQAILFQGVNTNFDLFSHLQNIL